MSDKSRRVFLTRSAEGCARWRPQLEALGHEVLSLPVIRFATLPAGGVELSNYNWVILTSPQGAKAYSAVFGGEVSAIKPSIATMAKATRTVLEASGQRDALGIEAGGGKELADALCQRLPAASRLLLPGAEQRHIEPARTLRGAGFTVDELALYRTEAVPVAELPADPSRDGDFLFFASPSAVAGFAAAYSLCDRVCVAIGETTAQALRDLGVQPRVAARPSLASMMEWLVDPAPGQPGGSDA